MKRTVCLVSCLLMTVSILSGCGSSTGSGEKTSTRNGAASEQSTVDRTPITFSFFRGTSDPYLDLNGETPVAKKIKELTGVSIEFQLPTGDFTEKVSLMCASGDYPDLIHVQEASQMLYDAGAVLKLDDMIDEYGPNIKKFYSEAQFMRMMEITLSTLIHAKRHTDIRRLSINKQLCGSTI